MHARMRTGVYMCVCVRARACIHIHRCVCSIYILSSYRIHLLRRRVRAEVVLRRKVDRHILLLLSHHRHQTIFQGILQGGSITVPLTSCLTASD
jgi:hypothetical protein